MDSQLSLDKTHSLDCKDDSKKKTVTFAMVQSPSADSVASLGSTVSVNQASNNSPDILLISPAHEVRSYCTNLSLKDHVMCLNCFR